MRATASASASVRTAPVPFYDLGPSHEPLRAEILAAIAELLDSNAYTNGPQVAELEKAWAAWCGAEACVGVASGLDALRLSLLAAGIEPGDEVVVPAFTFAATLEAVTQAGGIPVLADAGESDLNLDPDAAAAACGPRTRFLLPVHLYGQPADLARLQEVARRHGAELVEDACQAHGATRDGRTAGTAGRAGAFSFYPAKNLGALGDAGAVVTNDAGLAERVRSLREHGQRRKYDHEREGYTARLDTIQAVALLRKLPHLRRWTDERREAARRYTERLEGVGDLRLPPVPAGSDPVWHLYVVRTADPAALARDLAARGIGSGRHYPVPVHLSPAYRRLGYSEGAFPVAERLATEVISLPIFPGITEGQIERVAEAIEDCFARG
jgi:dTDP-4-amino-4,6-dideoxygalactose transaminase